MDNINEKPNEEAEKTAEENLNVSEEKALSKRQSKKEAKKEKKKAKKEKKEAEKQGKKKLSKEDKKGVLLIAVLAVIVIVLLSVCINAGEDKDASATTAVTTTAPTATTAPPPATMPYTTTQPSTGEDVTVTASGEINSDKPTEIDKTTGTTTAQPTTETTQKSEPTDAEILDAITKGINSLQTDTASFRSVKNQVIYVQLNDCSVPFLTSTINKVIEFFTGEEVYEYDFTNGKAIDPEEGVEVAASHVIPPTDKPFSLTLDGVADTSVTESDKGTVYSVTVVPERSTLENPRPPHHNAACDTLDFSAFELPVGEITKADFEYPGATVWVTIDKAGKIVEYREKLVIKGTGEGNAFGITASGEMEGYVDEAWTIEWK